MAQVMSRQALVDMLEKLKTERIPVFAFAKSPIGEVLFKGFVDSITPEGLLVSASGPPMDAASGYVNFSVFSRPCGFMYKESRELDPEFREAANGRGESSIEFRPTGTSELFALFFTI